MTVSVPNGWRLASLGEVCHRNTGVRDPRAAADEPFVYVDISSVDNRAKRIVEPRTILGKDAPSRARQVIRTNDILVATTRPNLNAVAQVPSELDQQICSTGFCVLRPIETELESDFLFSFVRSTAFVNALSDLVKRALYPAVTDAQVLGQGIALPPLPEQKRIAAMLNEQMASTRALHSMADGLLGAAQSLNDSYLEGFFSSSRASSWRMRRIDEVATGEGAISDGPFGSHLKTEHYTGAGARVVRLQNIARGEFLDSDKAYVSLDHFSKLTRHAVQPDDIVVAALGDGARPAGRACLIPPDFGIGLVKADCFRIRVDPRIALPEFVMAYLNSPRLLRSVNAAMRGATRPRVTLAMLRETRVPTPSLAEQAAAVSVLSTAFAQSKSLVQMALETSKAVADLPAKLLAQAFSDAI